MQSQDRAATVVRDLAGEGNAPDLGLAALPYRLMPKPLTHVSLLPKQDAPLPCLGEWGGLPRALRRECPGAAGKANDRLENWGIRLTGAWAPSAGVYQAAVQFGALQKSAQRPAGEFPRAEQPKVGKKPTAFIPPCPLLVPGGADSKAGLSSFNLGFFSEFTSRAFSLPLIVSLYYPVSWEPRSFQAFPSSYG